MANNVVSGYFSGKNVSVTFDVDVRVAMEQLRSIGRTQKDKAKNRRILRPAARMLYKRMRRDPTPHWLLTTKYKRKYREMGLKKRRKHRKGYIHAGNLRKSQTILKGLKNTYNVIVGPQFLATAPEEMGLSPKVSSGFYATWVAQGTRMRFTKKTNQSRGRIRPSFYPQKQVWLNSYAIRDKILTEYRKFIRAEGARYGLKVI